MITLINADCTEYMKNYPCDKFDLAIVDPPYGHDIANTFGGKSGRSGQGCAEKTTFEKKDWDKNIPDEDYFLQLFRVSKNQIIWGANNMIHLLPPSRGWVVWDKNNGTTKFGDCELAFTSFDRAIRKITFTWNGMIQENMKEKEKRIHPTQKPVALYRWLLYNYAKEGDIILDTHLGSGSSAIAAHRYGHDFVGIEIDEIIFKAAEERIKKETKQLSFFKKGGEIETIK